jgi:predicted metal-dependent HD superfamily phosphohydrolase
MSTPAAQNPAGLDRFQTLWRRCLINGMPDHSATIHQQIIEAYGEPHRRYHTLAHIEHCLAMFDQCKSLALNADALELAVWFHDVILQPGRNDDESRSAELYLQLSDQTQTSELRELVARLIIATQHSGGSLEDADAIYMIDIDLSSFGLSWDEFQRDSQNLREEYPECSDVEYHRRQEAFRSALASRESFFSSGFFSERYEQQAQENLSKYFKEIRG